MSCFSKTRGMIIDMDGVLWRGNAALPGVKAFFSLLRRKGVSLMLATNNATTSPETVQDRLHNMGIEVDAAEVLTTAEGTAQFLLQHMQLSKGSNVYVIGESPLRMALLNAGFEIVDRAEQARVVTVGLDRGLTWEDLAEAVYAIQRGARFVATNPDPSLPTERGLAPGTGAILACLEAVTGCSPMIFGKPEPHIYLQALQRLGTPPQQTVALGDRLETDILGGQRAGLRTALVLTGVTDRRTLSESSINPDWVFDDLDAVCLSLKGAE